MNPLRKDPDASIWSTLYTREIPTGEQGEGAHSMLRQSPVNADARDRTVLASLLVLAHNPVFQVLPASSCKPESVPSLVNTYSHNLGLRLR